MRLGFIVECGPQGIDGEIMLHFALRIAREKGITLSATPAIRTMDNKPKLIDKAANVARSLLQNGHDMVFIVWDLEPAWNDKKPCRKQDRDNLLDKIASLNLDANKIVLLCVEKEIEAWLLADGDALSAVVGTQTRPAKIKHTKKPDGISNAKKVITKVFREHGRTYDEFLHPRQILKQNPKLKILQTSVSFKRFWDKMGG